MQKYWSMEEQQAEEFNRRKISPNRKEKEYATDKRQTLHRTGMRLGRIHKLGCLPKLRTRTGG